MKELENKLLKARVELMTRSVFISTIALSLRHIISDIVPTAGTDAKSFYYNPEFLAKQSVQETAGLIAHECWHVAFQHIGRLGKRDPIIWNAAGDYVINPMLLKDGFIIPKGGLVDNKYQDMSTDEVYDLLIKEKKDFSPEDLMLDLMDGEGMSEAEKAEVDAKITDVLVRAYTQSKLAGKEKSEVPGEIVRVIEDLLNPKMPWRVLLHKYLDAKIKDEYSWSRRNRRYDNYMPSLHSDGLGHLTFAIDTSGSMTDEELHEILSEIKGIRDVFNPEKMTIIDCDSRIHHVHEVDQNTDILSLTFSGGGGTRFQPVLDYVSENPTQALIYFTDLYGEADPKVGDYGMLWVCSSEHAPMPTGETIYMN